MMMRMKAWLALGAVALLACNKNKEQGVIPNAESQVDIPGFYENVHTPDATFEIIEQQGGSFLNRITFFKGYTQNNGIFSDVLVRMTLDPSSPQAQEGTFALVDAHALIVNGNDTAVFEGFNGDPAAEITLTKNESDAFEVEYKFSANSENPCLGMTLISGTYSGLFSERSEPIAFPYVSQLSMADYNGFYDLLLDQCYTSEVASVSKLQLDQYTTNYELILGNQASFAPPLVYLDMYSGDENELAPGYYRPGVIGAGNFLLLNSSVELQGQSLNVVDGEIRVFKSDDNYEITYWLETSSGRFEGNYSGPIVER